jgi:hypothetical protein
MRMPQRPGTELRKRAAVVRISERIWDSVIPGGQKRVYPRVPPAILLGLFGLLGHL